MIRDTSSLPLRARALVTLLAGSLVLTFALVDAASASTPAPSSLIASVIANMKTVPVVQVSGTQSGMKVTGLYVAHPQNSEVSLSGKANGTTLQVSMIEVGKQNWMKANEAGWELFTLGTVPKSTLAKLSASTWYVSQGSTTVNFGDSLCPTTSSTSSTCTLKGTKIVSYSPSKAVISATSPKETITLASVKGKFLPVSIVAPGSNGVSENMSYPASAANITAPVGAKPFPT